MSVMVGQAGCQAPQNAESILVSLCSEIAIYFDVRTLLSLTKTNRACRQAYWENDSLWKGLVQAQMFLFGGQEVVEEESSDFAEETTHTEDLDNAHLDQRGTRTMTPWRQFALIMKNVLEGRYRVALLDPRLQHDENDSDDSDFVLSSSDEDSEEEETLGMDVDETDMTSTNAATDDSPPLDDVNPNQPVMISVDNQNVPKTNALASHLKGCWLQSQGPHHWWASMLYQHYKDNLLISRNFAVEDADLPPWSYDHSTEEEEFPALGTMRSCPFYADLSGALVFSSWRGDLAVVDLGSGNDRIVRRLSGYGSQDWRMGDDFVIGRQFVPLGVGRFVCHYDLLDEMVSTASLDINLSSPFVGYVCCAHGDYALATIGSCLSLLHLDRSLGSLRVVYQSDRLTTEIRGLLTEVESCEDTRVGRRIAASPTDSTTNNQDDISDQIHGMMVFGRILFVCIDLSDSCCVVDMKCDTLLYSISTRDFEPLVLGSTLRGGVLGFRTKAIHRSSALGVVFGPCLPRIDETHRRFFQLLEAVVSVKENPFHRHPNTRLPLRQLLGVTRCQKLCRSSDQSFLLDLHFEWLMEDVQIPTIQLVLLNEEGEMIGRDRWWSLRSEGHLAE